MKRVFFIVGPTAAGKSEIAAEIACQLDGEIVSADAFQIYRGMDRLTAKPEKAILAKAPHHLLSAVPLSEEMNVEKFRAAAVEAIRGIHSRGKHAIVAGGSGLYVRALTHGLSRLPGADPKLRAQLSELSLDELRRQLVDLDPEATRTIDMKNRRRVTRALEIRLLTGKPILAQRTAWPVVAASLLCEARRGQILIRGDASRSEAATGEAATSEAATGEAATGEAATSEAATGEAATSGAATDGVFVFRERAELYQRIERRVEKMFAEGVVDEVRALDDTGSTAEKALGLREIRALLAGEISEAECIGRIQQCTRRYAKRQLTWFQRQDNFQPLNLSSHGYPEAIESIAQNARLAFAQRDD